MKDKTLCKTEKQNIKEVGGIFLFMVNFVEYVVAQILNVLLNSYEQA